MKIIKKSKREGLLYMIILIITFMSIFIFKGYHYSQYVYIKPIISLKDIAINQRLTADLFVVGRDEQVLKKDVNNYLSSENYKTILSENSYFSKNIKFNKRLEFQDIKIVK